MFTEQNPHAVTLPDAPSDDQRSKAVRVTASHARDTAEFETMLDMLGLSACEGREPGSAPDSSSTGGIAAQHGQRGNRRLLVSELRALLAEAPDRAS
ncbi:hypothetical protein [Haloechinothrix sp. LS1_15]|uniref:hypothetical protein n=1 Tax=Haloechinothrix sp. LS1_15 TaxID=2652248 RepID=UPI002944A04B|nr:hypothetical protein [Haloechinothrix sp. LS1_15]MDV6014233.1 hypothetical protein [Haloechinothrix sp. LS1_15]